MQCFVFLPDNVWQTNHHLYLYLYFSSEPPARDWIWLKKPAMQHFYRNFKPQLQQRFEVWRRAGQRCGNFPHLADHICCVFAVYFYWICSSILLKWQCVSIKFAVYFFCICRVFLLNLQCISIELAKYLQCTYGVKGAGIFLIKSFHPQ